MTDRIVNPPLSAAERVRFVEAARACIDVPWRHQGRTTSGLDCGGLVVFALGSIGRLTADITGYPRLAYRGSLEDALRANFGDPLPAARMQVGDLALIRFTGAPNHIVIIADYLYGGFSMVHAYAPERRVIEQRLDDVWRARIAEIYRP